MKLNIPGNDTNTGNSSCDLVKKESCHTGIAKQPTSPAIQQKQCRPNFDMLCSELARFLPVNVMAEVKRLKMSGQGPKIVKLVGKHNFVRAMSLASRRVAEPREQLALRGAAADEPETKVTGISTKQSAAVRSGPSATVQLPEAQKKGLFDQFRMRNKAEQSALWIELSSVERKFLQQAVEAHAALNRSRSSALEELSQIAFAEFLCDSKAQTV